MERASTMQKEKNPRERTQVPRQGLRRRPQPRERAETAHPIIDDCKEDKDRQYKKLEERGAGMGEAGR
jgi:hypothetical protein